MATSKWQLQRLQQIHSLLSMWEGGCVSKDTLIERCGVSERSLKGDISYMREQYGAPIYYDRKEKGYRYTEPFTFFPEVGLKLQEITDLRLALETLSQYQHVPLFADVEGLLDKLQQVLRQKLRSGSGALPISFERVPPYKGKEWVRPLLQAIEQEETVSFTYQSFQSTEWVQHFLSPYLIKEHTHRWYILGRRKGQHDITTFALDRIQAGSLTAGGYAFEKAGDFDPETHFAYTVGMTVHAEQEPEEVQLRFTAQQAKYFLSKPFHPYELIREDGEGLVVRMWLRPNYELVRLLAGLGAGVQVLMPEVLVKRVKCYLQDGLRQYD